MGALCLLNLLATKSFDGHDSWQGMAILTMNHCCVVQFIQVSVSECRASGSKYDRITIYFARCNINNSDHPNDSVAVFLWRSRESAVVFVVVYLVRRDFNVEEERDHI